MNELHDRLREVGKNGGAWREAQAIAEASLADPCDPDAFDRAMDAFEGGLIDRARAAFARSILAKLNPPDPFIEWRADLVTPPVLETVDLREYYDIERIDRTQLAAADLTQWNAHALIERAAEAAWLEPEQIVDIVGEFCPLPDKASMLAEIALSEFQGRPRFAPKTPADWRAENAQLATAVVSFAMLAASGPTPASVPAIVRPEPAPSAFDLDAEPGLLGDIARWSQTFAYRPVREFAQPAAIATLAAIFGRRWATPTGLGLNLYLVAIAETGGGKDALLAVPRRLLAANRLRR
jgi:hypothetical protein